MESESVDDEMWPTEARLLSPSVWRIQKTFELFSVLSLHALFRQFMPAAHHVCVLQHGEHFVVDLAIPRCGEEFSGYHKSWLRIYSVVWTVSEVSDI